jgi:acetate kinase
MLNIHAFRKRSSSSNRRRVRFRSLAMSARGVRRRGGFGLFHRRADVNARAAFGREARRVISVFLGNRSNLAAIEDGRPRETTMGFDPTEGLPSATACGSIDPTIVFELFSGGVSLREINEFHTYSTYVQTEKSMWVPLSGYDENI